MIYFATEITVGRFVFPGGKELEKTGVTPDQACLPSGEALRKGEDPCFDLALSLARKAAGLEPAAAAAAQ